MIQLHLWNRKSTLCGGKWGLPQFLILWNQIGIGCETAPALILLNSKVLFNCPHFKLLCKEMGNDFKVHLWETQSTKSGGKWCLPQFLT